MVFFDFISDDTVKQADVVLLGYPLMVDMTEEERKNDLDIYEKVSIFLASFITKCRLYVTTPMQNYFHLA